MLEAWEADMESVEYLEPSSICTDTIESAGTTTNRPSFNWSGFVAHNASNNNWVAVQGNFTQPALHKRPKCIDAALSSWVGLGGYDNGRLIQIGTKIDVNGHYQTFINRLNETSKHRQDHPLGLKVHPGDQIHLYLNYQTSNEEAELFILDKTTGGARPIHLRELGPRFYNGSNADFIDERPLGPHGNLRGMANFGVIHWTEAKL
jgi:hypothetical protein